MSTPEEQLDRAHEAEATERSNGGGRARRAARKAARAAGMSSTNGDDATQVSSDASAPAPPRRRGAGSTAHGTGQDTVANPAPPPLPELDPLPSHRREPVAYSTAHAEAEAVLLDDSGEYDDPYPARSAMTGSVAPMYGERRVRQTISKVDLWSVTKLSLCFYISSMFVVIVALVSLWLIADAAGVIKSVENFLGDLLEAKNFTFLSGDVLRGTILVGLVIVALQVVITVIAASFYNIFAELFGGLEITVKEEEDLR